MGQARNNSPNIRTRSKKAIQLSPSVITRRLQSSAHHRPVSSPLRLSSLPNSESSLQFRTMSRICVKNLPKYATEDRIREFFSQKGEVTDAKLMRTKDGKSRQFAFIGFRSEQEAEEAIRYFDKSYLDTSRIVCEIARKVGDPDIPRPWSRHTLKKVQSSTKDEEKTAGAKSSKGEGKDLKKGSKNDDPQLQEFLQVMQPRVKSKLWANDILVTPSADQNIKGSEKHSQGKMQTKENSAPMRVIGEEDETKIVKSESSEGYVDEKSKNPAHEEVASDMDYFKSRIKKEWSDSESSDENDDSDNDTKYSHKKSLESEDIPKKGKHDDFARQIFQEDVEDKVSFEKPEGEISDLEDIPTTKDEKQVLDTGRLFVRNLSYIATEDELEELFGKYGNVSQVHIVVDKDTKRSKGIAYVLYASTGSATRALEELDSSIFQGRLLHVMPAKEKSSPKEETSASQAPKTFKQNKEEERKASEAGGNTKAWNSLFMRPDTVVENIAKKYGVSKSHLLDREADDLAVRIALGETQVIAETKNALANAGINVASLEEFASGKADGMKRSNHALLVKNLPYGSTESELAKMFGKFGSLDKIVLPPTKTMALIVFLEAAEARVAFRGLAYKRYKDAPLYLEWAPGNILIPNFTSEKAAIGEDDAKRVLLEQSVEGISDMDVDPDRIESRSLYVKNLNFKTSDESLKKHFSEHVKKGQILSVRVKKHLKNGKNVSMGFGFVQFDSMETATTVCRDLQGTILDGHALILQLCHAKKDEQDVKKVDKDKMSTKVIVRNVAFEATEKDIRQLFSPFGQIKSVRLPRKLGNHRGFAFVEYVTKQEAQNALQSLSNTHLYGRHLVLERAKEGESLEELRARTAAQFTDEHNGFQNHNKLSKKRKNMAVLDESSMQFKRFAN